MAIKIVNKHFHNETNKDIYIAKPSIFGNPWSHLESSFENSKKTKTRKEAVDNYTQYFLQEYKNNQEFKQVIDELAILHKNKEDINLVCYCVGGTIPENMCHGYVIKKFIEYKANKE